MLEQIDHRGKRFTIDDDDVVDEGRIDRCRRVDALERQAQREFRELERRKRSLVQPVRIPTSRCSTDDARRTRSTGRL